MKSSDMDKWIKLATKVVTVGVAVGKPWWAMCNYASDILSDDLYKTTVGRTSKKKCKNYQHLNSILKEMNERVKK